MSSTLPRRAFLGAELLSDAEAFCVDGVIIAGVVEDGMAARAGLIAGDVIVSLAGAPVRDLCELAVALRRAGAGATAEVAYQRAGARYVRIVDVVAMPCEHHTGATTEYGELVVGETRLRTIEIRCAVPRALVLVIQGIACESVDHGASEPPLAALVAGWARAGYDSLRFDKRGVGDSEGGPCRDTDFQGELDDARAAYALARSRGIPLVVFGHSVGGIIAPLVGEADGIIVYGTPVMPWIDCLVDSTRRQLTLRGASEAEILEREHSMRALVERGELNGRSAAYHAQLAAVDPEAAWRTVEAPVLVVRGEHDWVVHRDDQARIADLARGETTIVDVPDLDHLFGWHADHEVSLRDYGSGRADAALATATVGWLGSRSWFRLSS